MEVGNPHSHSALKIEAHTRNTAPPPVTHHSFSHSPSPSPVSLDGGQSAVLRVQPLVLGAPDAWGVVPGLAAQPLLCTEHGH